MKVWSRHCDLPTFLKNVESGGLSVESTVYKGTLYEYVAQQALFNAFEQHGLSSLMRTGGASDKGVDLFGKWKDVPVIVQCKCWNKKVGPTIWRETAGVFSYHSAARSGSTLMMLVTPTPMTAAATREFSTLPVPLMHCQIAPIKPFTGSSGGLEYNPAHLAVLTTLTNSAADKLELFGQQTNRIRQALGLVLIPVEEEEPTIQGALDDTIEQQLEQLQKLRKVEPVQPSKTLIEESSSAQSFLKRMKQLQAKIKASKSELDPKADSEPKAVPRPHASSHVALSLAEPAQESAQPAQIKAPRPKTHVKPVEDALDRVEIFEPKFAKTDYSQAPKFKVRNSKSKKRKLEQQVDVPSLSAADFKLEQGPALHIEVPQQPREEAHVTRFESGEKKAAFQVRDSASLLKKLSDKAKAEELVSTSGSEPTQEQEQELAAEPEPQAEAEAEQETELKSEPAATGPGLEGVSGMLQRLRANGSLEERESTRNPQWIKSVAAERAKRAADLARRRPLSAEAKVQDDYYNQKEELELAKKHFKDYEPVVDLQYFGKSGEKVSAKQAWKDLSHKFHGTGEHKR